MDRDGQSITCRSLWSRTVVVNTISGDAWTGAAWRFGFFQTSQRRPSYFKAVREVCDRHGVLLILDEVMCGMGRTGTLHAASRKVWCPT
jgi:hypothetical protein